MVDRFKESQMLKLVLTYRDYPCLWNVTSDLYKNRDARESAYKELCEKLNIPGLTVRDIPKKIKNMRSSYYQEIKKMEKSIRSGASQDEVYKPKVSWFTIADGFLKAFRDKHETFSYEPVGSGEDDTATQDNSPDVELIKIEGAIEPNSDPLQDTIPENPTTDYFPSSNPPSVPSRQTTRIQKRIITRRKRPYESVFANAIQRLESTVSNAVNCTPNRQEVSLQGEDEFHMFALSVAAQLRQLPLHVAISTQSKIQSMLSEARLASIFSSSSTQPSISMVKTEEESDY